VNKAIDDKAVIFMYIQTMAA